MDYVVLIGKNRFLLKYLLFFFVNSAFGASNSEQVVINWHDVDCVHKIDQLLSEPKMLCQVTYSCDINFTKKEFIYLVDLPVGQLINAKNLKNAFFYLDLRRLFDKICLIVSDGGRGLKLHFILNGSKRLDKVKISGILFGKEYYRQLYMLEEGACFEKTAHQIACRRILTDLRNEGYFNADVKSDIKINSKTKLVTVNLNINRGCRFKIAKIDFELIEDNSIDELEIINKKIAQFFKKYLLCELYSDKLLKKQLGFLKRYLARAGYPYAQINFNFFKNNKLKKIRLVFNVMLNQKQKFIFVDNHFFSNDMLFNHILLSSGMSWRLPLSLVANDIVDLYKRHGFEQVEVEGVETDEGYKFLINEGRRFVSKNNIRQDDHDKWLKKEQIQDQQTESREQILFGKTVLRGNAKIRFDKLYKILAYKKCDDFDQQKLKNSFFRLKNLDAFDLIRAYPVSGLDFNGYKPMILNLSTDHDFEFRTRLGFQKVSKNFDFQAGGSYKAGVSAIYKNLTSCADQLIFDADLTRFYRYIVAQYKRPVFSELPLFFATKLYINKYDQPIFIGSKNWLYHIYQQGALIDVEYKDQILNANLSVGIESDQVSDISMQYAHAIDFSDALLAKKVPFLFMEQALVADYLDDKVNPNYGVLILANIKGMVAMGSKQSYFLKILVEQSAFLPISKTATIAIRLGFGHIFTNQFNIIMPIERFYLGGAYSIRSYEPDFAPPLGVVKTEGCDILVPQGGATMVNACFELRMPIYQNLGAVIFQDLGALLKSGSSLGQGELLTATGFGLRYSTPVGPLRFDIGWRPRKDDYSSNFAWFLTVGQAF